jgi:hypothetical protein
MLQSMQNAAIAVWVFLEQDMIWWVKWTSRVMIETMKWQVTQVRDSQPNLKQLSKTVADSHFDQHDWQLSHFKEDIVNL